MFSCFQFTESVRDKSLAFIDESFVETGYFLKGVSSRKRKCLQVFTECQSIVNWIRNETKGEFSATGIYFLLNSVKRTVAVYNHFISLL